MLCVRPLERVEQLLDSAGTPATLFVEQLQARQQQRDVLARGLRGPRGDAQRGGVKFSEHRRRRHPPNAMPSEQAGERCAAQRARGNRGRGELEQRPDPRLVDRRTEPEHLGIEPLQLLPQAIGQAPELRLQLLLGARQFPELNKQRVIDVHLPERGPVGAQRVGQDEAVPPVVLGSRGAVAVAKAIELLGIDGEHVEAALEQGLHDGPARHFDGDGDPRRLAVGEGRQPIRHLAQGAARVLDPALSLQAALGREHRELVSLARPVHPNVKCVRTLAHAPSLSDPRLTVVSRPTLYWRSRRDSPLDVHHGRPRWGATPFQVLRALGPAGAPSKAAEDMSDFDQKNGTGSRRSLSHAPASSPLPGARRFNRHWPRPLPGGEATRGLRTG